MKKLILFLLLMLSFCTGCGEKGQIYFYNQPVNKITALHPKQLFNIGEKIYYLYFNEKDFKTEFIRVKVIKAYETTNTGGYSVVYTKDYRLMDGEVKYHSDYFVIHDKGHYIMQVFAIENLDKDIGMGEFYIR